MPTNLNWPLVIDNFAFTGDPNDPSSTPTYTDLSARVRTFEASRGRQYEIDQNQTGTAHLVVSDKDEVLNPANTSAPAPFAGNIKPYRRYLRQAMWPPVPVGAATNLLPGQGIDPSFESYTAGATLPWVFVVGTGVAPTVQAATPWQGTKSLQYGTTAGTGFNGVGWAITCIPGQQYTTSAWVRQTGGNTTQIFIDGGAGGSTTTTTATYVRLAVTFVATAPSHNVWVASFTTTVTGTVNVDALQHESMPAPLNANPYFEVNVANWSGQGGTVARSTAQFHEGVASLLLTPNGVAATAEADSEVVPATANAPLRMTAWVRCSVARNVNPNINWFGAAGYLSTASGPAVAVAANTWTQLDYTPTAPANTTGASLVVSMTGTPPASNTLWIDEAILSGPSAFATSGPTIYTPFAGYVERWPSTWNHQGTYGMTTLACVDAMAVLAGTDMHTEYRGMLPTKTPDLYWPLSDGSNATAWAETSGNRGPALVRVDSSIGPGPAFSSGASMPIPGDPGATGVTLSGTGDFSPTPTTVLTAGRLSAGARPIAIGSATLPVGVTMSTWVRWSTLPTARNGYLMAMFDDAGAIAMSIKWDNDAGNFLRIKGLLEFAGSSPNITLDSPNMSALSDGKPHLIQLALSATTTVANLYIYIDGALQGTSVTRNPTTDAWPPPFIFTNVQVGGAISPFNGTSYSGVKDGAYAHAALWSRALSGQDVTDLWNAGQGYPGESSGQRISRLLALGGYTGPTAIDTGQSTMGVSTITEGAALLDACQQTTLSENGNLYVEGGVVTAKSRTDRYMKLTPTWTFGENQAGGEYPYERDIAYDYDPSRVVNDVSVSRVGGIKATAKDDASQKSYFRRSYLRTIGIQSDNETTDAANYLLNKGKQPIQRVSHLSIKPSANPALWPVALGIRIGDRVTVKRRTTAFTMSSDFFVEKIEHSNSAGSWVTSLQMSPVDRTSVWILGDPVYGQLGVTTTLAY